MIISPFGFLKARIFFFGGGNSNAKVKMCGTEQRYTERHGRRKKIIWFSKPKECAPNRKKLEIFIDFS